MRRSRARKGALISRSREGREFILAESDDFDREIELSRRNKAPMMKLLDERARQSETIALCEARARSRL